MQFPRLENVRSGQYSFYFFYMIVIHFQYAFITYIHTQYWLVITTLLVSLQELCLINIIPRIWFDNWYTMRRQGIHVCIGADAIIWDGMARRWKVEWMNNRAPLPLQIAVTYPSAISSWRKRCSILKQIHFAAFQSMKKEHSIWHGDDADC